jgi:hypothetical protein
MNTRRLALLVLLLLVGAAGHVFAEEEEEKPIEVTEASPEVVEALLAEHKAAVAAKEAQPLVEVLEKLAVHNNAEFFEPAKDAVKYKASSRDKKAVRRRAKELGDRSAKRIKELTLAVEARVQATAARVMGNYADAGKTLHKLFGDKRVVDDKPTVAAALIESMGRVKYGRVAKEVVKEFKKYSSTEVMKASIRYFGLVKTKDKDVVYELCRQLEPPQAGSVNSPSNPPASYWKRRWEQWNEIRLDVAWALEQITGQKWQPALGEKDGDGKRALAWVKEHEKELGLK